MKVTFEFNTGDDDFDYQELEKHLQADKMAMALSDILQEVRKWEKYEEDKPKSIYEAIDRIREIIVDNGVNMQDMGY